MKKKLTPKTIENARPAGGRLEIWDTLLPGFGVRIGSKKKSYVVMTRVGRQLRRITLGDFPEMTLAKARVKAREAMNAAQLGEDPGQVARSAYTAAEARSPIKGLVERFIFEHARKNRDWKKTQGIFRLDVLPAWGSRSVTGIRRRDVTDLVQAAAARTSSVSANRVLAHVRKFLDWCVDAEILQSNPAQGVKPPGREQSRERVLTTDEIRAFWEAADDAGYPFASIFRLLLVTAQRRDEVGSMRWSQIDFERGIWTVPAEASKNGKPNEVPLSPLAVAILGSVHRFNGVDLVFPARNASGNPASGYSKAKSRLDAAIRTRIGLLGGAGMSHWWVHDLRRTAASRMAEMGVAPHIIERILNHVTGGRSGVAGVYNRYAYFAEKRDALNQWSAKIEALTSTEMKTPPPPAVAAA